MDVVDWKYALNDAMDRHWLSFKEIACNLQQICNVSRHKKQWKEMFNLTLQEKFKCVH